MIPLKLSDLRLSEYKTEIDKCYQSKNSDEYIFFYSKDS